MLGPTPGHVTCHRASSPGKDLLLLPRRDGESEEKITFFLFLVLNQVKALSLALESHKSPADICIKTRETSITHI